MEVVWPGERGRCQSDPGFGRRQLRRCSGPWGAYSAGPLCPLHIPCVFCVQLKGTQTVKTMSWWDKPQFDARPQRNRRLDGLTGFTLVVHMQVLGSARTRVLPKQQVTDR